MKLRTEVPSDESISRGRIALVVVSASAVIAARLQGRQGAVVPSSRS